ncbi:MAG: allene oxide cyclase family protein [Actinomycetota bacterium]
MSRTRGLVAGAATLVLGLGIAGWTLAAPGGASPAQPKAKTTVHVIEHGSTDTVVDTDGNGKDSTGDLLTFHNKVFDATNDHRVGRDMGDCVRIDVRRSTWECRWTTFLADGEITVEGPFYDLEDTELAITGGTGAYANAQGSMDIQARPEGQYDFIFHLS